METVDKAKAFSNLKKQIEESGRKKIRLEEKLEAATQNMRKVVDEIRAAGYDPKTLGAVKAELESKLEKELDSVKKAADAQTAALAEIESNL